MGPGWPRYAQVATVRATFDAVATRLAELRDQLAAADRALDEAVAGRVSQ